MKILAFYLPQFHNIPENDLWWGDGFTEWTNVKAAQPLFEGHMQPKIPLGGNYYNLLEDDVKKWQVELAKKYGVYGFCYYHYWFDGKLLLEKPMEQMLANPEIDLPFCICWANEPWTKIWVGEEAKTLINQRYGGEKEWKEHFDYLLPFLKDKRYICENGKPLLCIYRPHVIPHLEEMVACWRKCAEEAGLEGLTIIGKYENSSYMEYEYNNCLDHIMEWQPSCAKIKTRDDNSSAVKNNTVIRNIKTAIERFDEKHGTNLTRTLVKIRDGKKSATNMDYDEVWKQIIDMDPVSPKSIPGAFVRWDNSPRKKKNEGLILGETPEKFRKNLSMQIKHAREKYNSDFMFMFAWNEWAEGGFLEPDEDNKYAYLEAVRDALKENNELE